MRTFFFLLIILPFWTFSQKDTVFIKFVEDLDSFPDCQTFFAVNGTYLIGGNERPKQSFNNFTYVDPAQEVTNGELRINSVRGFLQGYATFEKPLVFYKEIPYSVIDSLVRIEKKTYYWFTKEDLMRRLNLIEIKTESEWIEPEIEEIREDTIDWSKEIIGGPINVPAVGIIDGVYIRETISYLQKNDYFDVYPEVKDSLSNHYDRVRNEMIQPKLDSILHPFYISRSEVTNKEYREFVNYVLDSVSLYSVYDHLSDEEAFELLNLPKSQKKKIDERDKKDNLLKYGLRKPKDFYNDPKYVPYLSWLYYPQPERYYKRREINFSQIKYKLNDSITIAVYPDTAGFKKLESEAFEIYANYYFWHPAYDDFPVVNLTYAQMMAFCAWKEHHINKVRNADEKFIHIDLPTITQYEFAMKSIATQRKNEIFDRDNGYFSTYERDLSGSSTIFLQRANINLNSGIYMADEIYNRWYRSVSDDQFIFYNGNVSEAVRDNVDLEFIQHYSIKEYPTAEDVYCALGGNYKTGVLSLSDDQRNGAFYKRVLCKDHPDPLTGFRLVYSLEK